MNDTEHATQPRLLNSLRRLAATSLGILQTRLALAGIELEEEIQRLLGLLMLALGALLFFSLGLLVLTFLVVLAFWDTYRIPAFTVLTLLYLGLGGVFFFRLKSGLAARPPIFEATLGELEKDHAALKEGGVRSTESASEFSESGGQARDG